MKNKKAPELRFPEFSSTNENNHFTTHKFKDIFQFSTGKNIKQSEASTDFEIPCVRYGELYHLYDEVIRKIINKTNLDRDKLKFSHGDEILIPSAGEDPLDIGSASALTIKDVAIGRTINILRPKHESLYSQIFVSYYINQRLRRKIATLAKGVSISNVYNSDLKKLKINLPSYTEQLKVADFLSYIDQKIQQLRRKKDLLEEYKKGIMQKLFSQEIRFKDENGEEFPDWEKRKFADILEEHKLTSQSNEEVFSVSVHEGLINQIEHLGRSYAASNTDHYNLVQPDDIVYTKSPTGDFPYGIIKQSKIDKNVIVSPLYGVFTPETPWLGYILDAYFESPVNVHNYLHPIIQKGAKNTINITNTTFLSRSLKLPVNKQEQKKIALFLKQVDKKVSHVETKLELAQTFKKGLLQQMFV